MKKIIIDTDVLIHFNKAGQLHVLVSLYLGRAYIIKEVYNEIKDNKRFTDLLEQCNKFKFLKILDTPDTEEFNKEYLEIRQNIHIGAGEAVSMAYSKIHKSVIASSNLKDITEYCDYYNIKYLTTLDILCVAVHRKVLSKKEANDFIAIVRAKGSKLPDIKIENYHIAPEKLEY